MRKSKKLMSLLFAVIFVFGMLAGCSKDKGQQNNSTVSQTPQPTTQASNDGQASNSLPITGKQTTFTVWAIARDEFQKSGMKDYNDGEYFKELEKRTGIHINWQIVTFAEAQNSFNLSISSGDYPDAYYLLGQQYPGGFDAAIQDGVFIRLNELIDKFAPNYKKILDSDPLIKKDLTTDGGNIPAMALISKDVANPWLGPVIRQDWLDELGLKTPTTLDEWYTTLTTFKEKKNATAPYLLTYVLNYPGLDPTLLASFGLTMDQTNAPFMQIDNKVKCTFTEPAFKDYLTLMNKWYSEGLFDQEFYSRKENTWAMSAYTDTGKSGMWPDISTLLDLHDTVSEDKNMNVVAIPIPAKKAGEIIPVNTQVINRAFMAINFVVTSACKDPETFIKWCDYQYSDEGILLANYGIENKTFTMVDGKPKLSELITNNPDLSIGEATFKYLTLNYPTLVDPSGGMNILSEKCRTAPDIWVEGTEHKYNMPPIMLSQDEATQYSQMMADINTYAGEMIPKFIIGIEPLSKYDEFIKQINSMGIEEAISLQQAALDRYNAR